LFSRFNLNAVTCRITKISTKA